MQKGVDYTGVTIVFCCHDGRGRFVMARRSENSRDEPGIWDIGGGGLRFDEAVEDCLRREVREEYCCEVLDYEFLGFRDAHRVHNGVKTHWVSLDHLVLVGPSQVSIGEEHKLEELGWFTLDNKPVESESHSQLPVFWAKHEEKLKNQLRVPIVT